MIHIGMLSERVRYPNLTLAHRQIRVEEWTAVVSRAETGSVSD